MRSKWIAILIVAAAAIVLCRPALRAQTQSAQRTTDDGVYTEAQAERGKQLIIKIGCANCHGDSLQGGPGEVPPLMGGEFLSDWQGQTLNDLANQISSMPPDSSSKRTTQENVDIMTLLLQINGYPAGNGELPPDPAVLRQIKIVQ